MTPLVWITVGLSLLGAYIFVLGWNVLAAVASYASRTRRKQFPFGRCLLAASGPSVLPVSLPFALARWDCGSDSYAVAFFLLWGLSFWASGAIERLLPQSRIVGDDREEMSQDGRQGDVPSHMTNAQACFLIISGAIKGWLALAIGIGLSYGVGAVISSFAGLPYEPPSWNRLATRGSSSVLMLYGMAGFLVECLRIQEAVGGRPGLAAWSAARRLRFRLLACLACMAVGVGLYAGLRC